jgi:CHAT domain-containing protein/tetratricopeptide (TPR) repeat protein
MKRFLNYGPVLVCSRKYYLSICLVFSLILPVSSNSFSFHFTGGSQLLKEPASQNLTSHQENKIFKRFNTRMALIFKKGDLKPYSSYVDSIATLIKNGVVPDSSDLSLSCFYVGAYYQKSDNNKKVLFFLKKSAEISEKSGNKISGAYSNCLFNTGIWYLNNGDFNQSITYFQNSLEIEKSLYGVNSTKLIDSYSGISVNQFNSREYEKAIESINNAIRIGQMFPDSVTSATMASLYETRGVANISLANYDQAKINLEKAEGSYNNIKYPDINYANILSNLGTVYHFLGLKERSYYYYEKALKLFPGDNSVTTLNLIRNYALILGNDNQAKKGELLLSGLLKRYVQESKDDIRNYYFIVRILADYLREYKLNNEKALKLYINCFDYVRSHPYDNQMRDNVVLGYSLSLLERGEYMTALDSIQTLLFAKRIVGKERDMFINPEPDSIRKDGRTIEILNTKYHILLGQYRRDKNIALLESAAKTSELLITVLERIRLNIGEEGSRILLGDKYRNQYLDVISCLIECYIQTKNHSYLEKAFEYSEKSKVASLLASTREMKAIQNHIPPVLAEKEKELQRNIGFYGSQIAEEENKETPAAEKINLWKDIILEKSRLKDSLKSVFEKSYPEYYSLKYNTDVVSINKISRLVGKGKNYVSYIMSDSVLYTFVSNYKNQQLISQKIDTSFLTTINGFRKILTSPDLDVNSGNEFHDFQVFGFKLYSLLIEPIKQYLISDELIISPDNILSYIPFETFITSNHLKDNLLYMSLPYMMNDFTISYAYSATLLAESEKISPVFRNRSIVFAPSYDSAISIDSISNLRQSSGGFLKPLPFAKEESAIVSSITCGKLLQDSSATKSEYKRLAGKFDIIHLAMHTVINNQNPIFTKMLFSKSMETTAGNSGLNVYEIYEIPLTAKMVVLSSCNTGLGDLHSGEGVLSLARGFIYSGSKSVVMSLWEVDDKSGTDIVKMFYRHLKNGSNKSGALRKARIEYLKSAGQLRSHPYFWSTLVVYGDDSPLYISLTTKIILIIVLTLLIVGVVIYFKKRRYS